MDQYFATLPPDEIGETLLQKIQQYSQNSFVREYEDRLRNAWRYYYGYEKNGFHATSQVQRDGDQGELAKARLNHARALAGALHNLVVSPKIVWTPRAASLDYESVRQTELASRVLEHYWHNERASKFAAKACEEAIVFTEGFIHLEWDPNAGPATMPDPDDDNAIIRTGGMSFQNVSTWNVIRNPDAREGWEKLSWVIIRSYRNKYDLAAIYPDHDEEIRTSSVDQSSKGIGPVSEKGDTDEIPIYIFYHKPSPSLPFGREVRMLSDGTVVADRTLDLDEIPLYRVTPGDITGTPFGYSSFHEILGLQAITDSVLSSLTTNISTFGTQSIAVEKGSDVRPDDITGMRLIYYNKDSRPPQGINFLAAPPEQFQFLESLKDNMELLMGLNSVVRGETPGDRMSGAALALLQSQALQQASYLVGNYNEMLEALGTGVVHMIKRRATHPLKIAIVGRSQLALAQEMDVSAKALDAVEQVYVELGNPMSQSVAGRQEIASQLLEQGLIKTPEQLQQVLDTGRLDPVTRNDTEEYALILRENQQISEGVVPPVLISDNHLLHCLEHKIVAASPSARENPDLTEAYMHHIHQHYSVYYNVPLEAVRADPMYHTRMLVLLGQQPPEDPMAQMAAQQGAGGPPPEVGPPPEGLSPEEADAAAEEIMSIPAAEGTDLEGDLPSVPVNPATGLRWDPLTGGGII